MKLSLEDIQRKIATIKQKYCQELYNKKVDPLTLLEVVKKLSSEDTPENYYQAEAIRQSLEWYLQLK